jgi:hypothetical protein
MKETLLDYIIAVTETTMREKNAANQTQFANKRGFANADIRSEQMNKDNISIHKLIYNVYI